MQKLWRNDMVLRKSKRSGLLFNLIIALKWHCQTLFKLEVTETYLTTINYYQNSLKRYLVFKTIVKRYYIVHELQNISYEERLKRENFKGVAAMGSNLAGTSQEVHAILL